MGVVIDLPVTEAGRDVAPTDLAEGLRDLVPLAEPPEVAQSALGLARRFTGAEMYVGEETGLDTKLNRTITIQAWIKPAWDAVSLGGFTLVARGRHDVLEERPSWRLTLDR